MRPSIFLVLVVLIGFLGMVIYSSFSRESVLVTNSQGEVFKFKVEVAKTPEEQAMGLQHVDELSDDHGMWFVYFDSRVLTYWMKDTLIPLDIIFVDSGGIIQTIHPNVPPCFEVDSNQTDCPVYASEVPVSFVLEVPGGVSTARQIQVGDSVTY